MRLTASSSRTALAAAVVATCAVTGHAAYGQAPLTTTALDVDYTSVVGGTLDITLDQFDPALGTLSGVIVAMTLSDTPTPYHIHIFTNETAATATAPQEAAWTCPQA